MQIRDLQDLRTVIEILKVNKLEHRDKKVYQNLTVFEATRQVYETLTGYSPSQSGETR